MTIHVSHNSHRPSPFSSTLGRFGPGTGRPLMAMVEITNRCNMVCPICFSRADSHSPHVSLEEIKHRIDNLVKLAGPIPLQISGGEPTLHDDLAKIIKYANQKGFRNIELITNGILISQDPHYLAALVENGLTAVYLQFDGLETNTYMQIRGQDMSDVRHKSILAIRHAGICATLAVAVLKGVNDHEMGDIVRFAKKNIDTVRAINFQAAARFTGRFKTTANARGVSLAELTKKIEQQSKIPPGGFITDLLGHSHCNAMSLVFVIDGKLEPLFKHISHETLLDFLGEKKTEIIADLFKGKEQFARKHIINTKLWKVLLEASAVFGKRPNLQSVVNSKHLLLFAKSFMEQSALDPKRIEQCNYAIADTSGVYSFCAYNNIYRHKSRSKR